MDLILSNKLDTIQLFGLFLLKEPTVGYNCHIYLLLLHLSLRLILHLHPIFVFKVHDH